MKWYSYSYSYSQVLVRLADFDFDFEHEHEHEHEEEQEEDNTWTFQDVSIATSLLGAGLAPTNGSMLKSCGPAPRHRLSTV